MGKKKSQWWNFEGGTGDGNEATLYIYGDITLYDVGWWNWPDDVVPNRFKNELRNLGDVDTIHVRINSNGGSVFGAYAIMNLLKSHKAQIITYNDGIAASAATLIAMAGDKIISSLGAIWMIHLPLTSAVGNSNELKKTIEILDTITEGMTDIYHARTGIDRDVIMQMLHDETYMSSKEALEKGFVDEVTELEVVAYLNEDKTAAFFNNLVVNMRDVRNKDAFVAMLPNKSRGQPPKPQNIKLPQPQKEEKAMNYDEFKSKHPEFYQTAVQEGIDKAMSMEEMTTAKSQNYAEGVATERERIKEIDAMAVPGTEKLTSQAKYETFITAEQYAVSLIKAQKEQGVEYLKSLKADAGELEDIQSSGAPQGGDAEEEATLLAHAAERTEKNKR